jgi:hypothetical protein
MTKKNDREQKSAGNTKKRNRYRERQRRDREREEIVVKRWQAWH